VPKGSRLKLILHVGHDSLKEAQALAEAAVALEMDAVLVSAPSKYIAHTARRKRFLPLQPQGVAVPTGPCWWAQETHQAQAVVDILSHCADIPAFYYHYPQVYGDAFDVYELMNDIEAEVARRGLTAPNLVGAKLSIPLDEAAAAVETISAAPDNSWGLTVGLLDPSLWDSAAMQAVILFGWGACSRPAAWPARVAGPGPTRPACACCAEGPMFHKAIAAWEAGDLDGARAAQDEILAMRAEYVSLNHASTTANYQPQGVKAVANALGFDVGPCRLPLPLVDAGAAERAAAKVLSIMERNDACPDFSMLEVTTEAPTFDWTGVDVTVVPSGGGLTKPLLLLNTVGGYIGCGLFNIETSNTLKEVAA
jgi:dihydrodipicolinate synthase/N-acetylneuraminate lyase